MPRPPSKVPNLIRVARAAGVSAMTASNVLRRRGRFSAATRAKVLKAAKTLGYHPDPLVSRLMSHIRTPNKNRVHATIALLGPWSPDHDEAQDGYFARLVQGAKSRAAEKGFGCDRIITGENRLSGEPLKKVLRARGIECLLITPWTHAGGHFRFDWGPYAVVSASSALWKPALHRATPAHYLNIETALHRIRRFGYRRPGLVVETKSERLAHFAWSAAFLEYAQRHPRMQPVPILSGKNMSATQIHGWFLRERPDVVLSPHGDRIGKMLQKLGIALPQETGLVHLGGWQQDASLAQINQEPFRIGAAAVDLLVSMFYSGERGLSPNPLLVQIEGTWCDGPTLPRRMSLPRTLAASPLSR